MEDDDVLSRDRTVSLLGKGVKPYGATYSLKKKDKIIPENTPPAIAAGIIYFIINEFNLDISKSTINHTLHRADEKEEEKKRWW